MDDIQFQKDQSKSKNDIIERVHPFLIVLIGCMSMGLVSAQSPMSFVHPGALNSKADLDFVKAKIKAGAQPWTAIFHQVKGLATGGTNALAYINSSSHDANTSKK